MFEHMKNYKLLLGGVSKASHVMQRCHHSEPSKAARQELPEKFASFLPSQIIGTADE